MTESEAVDDLQGGEGRWYLVDLERNVVHYGPDTERACQKMAAEVSERVDADVKFSIIDRNGLVGFREAGGVEWTFTDNATHPDDVDGGYMGELLDAAFSGGEP